MKGLFGATLSAALLAAGAGSAGTILLYDQDFESPSGYVNAGFDVSQQNVNSLYGNQPPGFTFAQQFTVETLNITGSQRGGGTAAFATGYSDPSGKGGNFALGMLSNVQNDLLGLAFNVGSLAFLNLSIDISSIDLGSSATGGAFGSPFVAAGAVPRFLFELYDNPTGANGLGSGTPLSSAQLIGKASARDVFDWTTAVLGLSTAGNTNGNVILRIDLLEGGYAAFDNLRITASDTEGDVGVIPVPAAGLLLLSALAAFGAVARRRS
jgi:hypothetical protein